MSSRPQRPYVIAETRDRDLVRLYWPTELRPAFDALFDIDDAMGEVVSRSTQPALGAIKLAWWRDRLEELDTGEVPAEPRLQAASRDLLPRGVSGKDLADLEGGWSELLTEEPDAEQALQRGAMLFALAARLLGADPLALASAGRLFAAGGFQRRSLNVPGAFVVTDLPRPSRQVRPLTALAALAKRDLSRSEPEATPARAWTLLRHRLTGHF